MNILITGANGFIGKNIVEKWIDKYKLFFPSSKELNLLNLNDVKDFLKKNSIDIVIHSAKIDEVNRPNISKYEVLDYNLRMFFNLAYCKHMYKKMIYFGSGAEYNRKDMPKYVKENYVCKTIPEDPYGFAKYVMNKYTLQSSNIYNFCLFGVFGKYEEYRRRFISNNICRSIKGLQMTLTQDIEFDYLYIDDLIRILEWAIVNDLKYHKYNVCSGKAVRLSTVGKIISEVIGDRNGVIIKNVGMQVPYVGSNIQLLEEIGDFTYTDLKISIYELFQYYYSIKDSIVKDEL